MSEKNGTVSNAMAAEIAKINEAVAIEEKKVEKAYLDIGKLYVALHASNYESDFKPMFTAISEAEKAVREARERIREIRGVVCCDKCGNDMPKGQAFCSICGAKLNEETPEVDLDKLVKCEV
ncbi:MAG: hypothetical protein IKV35_00075, partial [Clostridia bacterium]|nr:hypothetical protein [Clostridia bacterium]